MPPILLHLAALLATGAAGGAPLTAAFSKSVANVEYVSESLTPEPPPHVRRTPASAGALRHGWIPHRLPGDVAGSKTGHFVAFAAEYESGLAVRAWCDTNFDGDLTDDPSVTLSSYPRIEGARSFLADLRWSVEHEGRKIEIDKKVRVVLEPDGAGDEQPRYRIQFVFAMMGEIAVEGVTHRAFLLDGDGDGLYTRSLADGYFVDLDDDGNVHVDQMSPEFGSFRVPSALGGTLFETVSIDAEGRELVLREAGAAEAPMPAPSIGQPAPDFAYTSLDGRRIRLSALRGRPVLVYFWASTCHTCRLQAEDLAKLYERLRPEGLEILGVSYDTDRAAMEAFRREHGQSWPTSFSGRELWEDPVGKIYRERGAGVFYLVDASGTLAGIYTRVGHVQSALDQGDSATGRRGGPRNDRQPSSRTER